MARRRTLLFSAIIVASLGAILLVVWLFRSPSGTALGGEPAVAVDKPSVQAGQELAPPPPSPPPAAEIQHKLIDAVHVDKTEPCVGDPVMVTVDAHGSASDGSDLYTIIDGRPGNPGVVRYDAEGRYTISVNVATRGPKPLTDQRVLDITVKRCPEGAATLLVDDQYLPSRQLYSFAATPPASLRDYFQKHLSGASFTWSFSDGQKVTTQVTTRVPYVEHSFGKPSATEVLSTYVIKLEARIGSRTFTGAHVVSRENLYATNKLRGFLVPETRVLSTERVGDQWRSRIHVTNPEPDALELQQATVQLVPCSGDAQPKQRSHPAEALTGERFIWQGDTELNLTYPVSDIPDNVCSLQVALLGTSKPGLPVHVYASLVVRPPAAVPLAATEPEPATPPNRADGASAAAPDLSAPTPEILHRAIALLGRMDDPQPTVTAEELQLLRRQGKL